MKLLSSNYVSLASSLVHKLEKHNNTGLLKSKKFCLQQSTKKYLDQCFGFIMIDYLDNNSKITTIFLTTLQNKKTTPNVDFKLLDTPFSPDIQQFSFLQLKQKFEA